MNLWSALQLVFTILFCLFNEWRAAMTLSHVHRGSSKIFAIDTDFLFLCHYARDEWEKQKLILIYDVRDIVDDDKKNFFECLRLIIFAHITAMTRNKFFSVILKMFDTQKANRALNRRIKAKTCSNYDLMRWLIFFCWYHR